MLGLEHVQVAKEKPSSVWIPLCLLSLLLAATPLGYLPVPGTAAYLTIAHVPVIVGAILGGPLLGAALGLIFGLGNWWLVPPHHPLVQITPRILSGLGAGMAFQIARGKATPGSQITVASIVAALAGSLINTLGVTLLGVIQGLMPVDEMLGVMFFHGVPEALVAIVVCLPIAVSSRR